MNTTTVIRPVTVHMPPGAPIAADLALGLIHGFSLLGAALGRIVTRKAAPPLPAVSARQRAAEATALRRHAQQMMSTDPRFAADLFAAADRHERDV